MAETRRAWVMDVGGGVAVAAGAAHVVEYLLLDAEPMPVPRTPGHCAGLMVWRERLIPVIDLARLLTGRAPAPGGQRRTVILAYQQAAGRPLQYGALFVAAAPTQTWVSDDMACALPAAHPALPQIARACFTHQDQAVAIVDPRQLFGRPLPTVPEAEVGAAVVDHRLRSTAPAPATGPVPAGDEAGERVPAIGADPTAGRRRERAPAAAVPYLQVVVPATPVAVVPALPVLPPSGGGEWPPAPGGIVVEETIDIEWPAALDDIAEPAPADAGTELPHGDDAPPAADIAPLPAASPEPAPIPEPIARAAAPARAPSNSVRSFERLRDLERRHTSTGRRTRWWPLAVAAVVLLLVVVIGAWSLTGPGDSAMPDTAGAAPADMVQDPAALAVHPASVPSTPAQPPD